MLHIKVLAKYGWFRNSLWECKEKKTALEYEETKEGGVKQANTTRESDILQMNVILTPGVKGKITISMTC
jgi:hypothetical protein